MHLILFVKCYDSSGVARVHFMGGGGTCFS